MILIISRDFDKTLNISRRNEDALLNAIQSDDVEKLQKIISNQNIYINEKFPIKTIKLLTFDIYCYFKIFGCLSIYEDNSLSYT